MNGKYTKLRLFGVALGLAGVVVAAVLVSRDRTPGKRSQSEPQQAFQAGPSPSALVIGATDPEPPLPSVALGPVPAFTNPAERKAYLTRETERELASAKAFEHASAELEIRANELRAANDRASERVVLGRVEELRARAARHGERASLYEAQSGRPEQTQQAK